MDKPLPIAEPVILHPLNEKETCNARLTEQHKALQIQQGYLLDIGFILGRRLGDLGCLALQRQTCVVIAIKQAEIRATYNETQLLREHLSRRDIGSQNCIQIHVIYKPLIRLKLWCDPNTTSLSESVDIGLVESPFQHTCL
jgi:hypothetical protein